MKTTVPLAFLFAAVLGGGVWLGNGSFIVFNPSGLLIDIHIAAVCAAIALVLYADEQALLWILGIQRHMRRKTVRFLHYAVALGLGCVILTGALIFLPAPAFYLAQPAFIVKMIAVAALIINTYFIDRFSIIAVTRPFPELPYEDRAPLYISGAASLLGWGIALIAGLLLR